MKYVTILESDESARTAFVQLNDSADIGNESASGENARLTFGDGEDQEPWKGSVVASLQAAYPGATVHTPDAMNAVVKSTLIAKGLRVELADGSLVTPAEKKRLDDAAAAEKARIDELAAIAAAAAAQPVEDAEPAK